MPYGCVSISQTPAFFLAALSVTPQAFLLQHKAQETGSCQYVPQYPLWSWSFMVLSRSPPRMGLLLLVTPSCLCTTPREDGGCGRFACVLPGTWESEAGEHTWVWKLRTPYEFWGSDRTSSLPVWWELQHLEFLKRSHKSCLHLARLEPRP